MRLNCRLQPLHLSELVQTHAPPLALRSSDACCWSFLAYTPNWPVTLFLLLLHPPGTLPADIWLRKHSHFQTPLENLSVQTHLVLLCCVKHLCICGPKGTMRIHYYAPAPVGEAGALSSHRRPSSVRLMSRTWALTRKPKGLGRRNFAQGYVYMRLPHRLQGQKVKSQGHGAAAYCGGHLAA